jgi:hypothetical protein
MVTSSVTPSVVVIVPASPSLGVSIARGVEGEAAGEDAAELAGAGDEAAGVGVLPDEQAPITKRGNVVAERRRSLIRRAANVPCWFEFVT